MKTCPTCQITKSIDDFYSRGDHKGPQGHCKDCIKQERAKYREKKYSQDPNWTRKFDLKKYGLTVEQYNSIFIEQNGCCAICGKHQSEFKRILSVDHNHITGQVRGLLCTNCNPAIGSLDCDNGTMRLQKAIDYINKFKPVLADQNSNVVPIGTSKR